MKQIKVLSLLTLAVLTSCQNETAEPSYNDRLPVVKIEATVGGLLSRSNPVGDRTTQKRFNSGDQMVISADTQASVTYTFDNDTWTSEAGKELKWKSNTMTFAAYHPVSTGTTIKDFTLPADQSTAAKIATADYMTFRGSKDKPTDSPSVSIALERRMARVIIKLEKINLDYAKDKRFITDVAIHSGAASYADSAASGDVTSVIPFGQGLNTANQGIQNSTYTALMIPTEAKSDETFVTLTDGADKALSVKGIPALEAGKSYTYKLSVGKKELEIDHVTVEDWSEGDTIGGDNSEAMRLVLTADANTVVTNQLIERYVYNGELILEGVWTPQQFKVVSSYCQKNPITKLDFSQTTGLTELGDSQFRSSLLVTIKLPITVTTLKEDAFASCFQLTTIDGLENIGELGKHPFSSCRSLTTINCPKVTRMGDDLFYMCSGLTEIRFTAESFTYVLSHLDRGTHYHPFNYLRDINKATLYLNASQEANVVTENGTIVWKPFSKFGTIATTGYLKTIPLTGFKAIYCGDKKIYPN